MLITVFLFSFSWQWTDEFYTRIFFTNLYDEASKVYLMPDIYTNIPEALIDPNMPLIGDAQYKTAIQNTAGLLIIAPLVILYLFCQRYLVQGIERSGLVG